MPTPASPVSQTRSPLTVSSGWSLGDSSLFSRFGVELEYMIVDRESLDIRAAADLLIAEVGGDVKEDVDRGAFAWSNELAMHVIELKTAQPAPRLAGLADGFQNEVRFVNQSLKHHGLCLLPTAMHPWMNPHRETRLWTHECGEIYATFDRIFGCRGHGWSNLQSTHLNLPFNGDEEFVRLHAAIRLLLPLLPALAASSPYADGHSTGHADNRLYHYRRNCRRIPSVAGAVIPEPAASMANYRTRILDRIAADVRPHDPEQILQPEWTNARGAIARFDRGAIEIRVLDIQEHPAADLAILQLIVAVLRHLIAGEPSPFAQQFRVGTQSLARLLRATTLHAERTVVDHARYLQALGFGREARLTAAEIWSALVERCVPDHASWKAPIDHILTHGPLSSRLIQAAGPKPRRDDLRQVCKRLVHCLDLGEAFP